MKFTNPYVKNEIDYMPQEKVSIKTLELDGVCLDFAVALSIGYKDILTECKQGGSWIGFDIVDNAISPFWRCVEGHRDGRGKYPMGLQWFQPTQDANSIIEIIRLEKIDIKFNHKQYNLGITASYDGKHEVNGFDLYNTVCKCVVLKNIGEVVNVPVVLTKEISTEYKLIE